MFTKKALNAPLLAAGILILAFHAPFQGAKPNLKFNTLGE